VKMSHGPLMQRSNAMRPFAPTGKAAVAAVGRATAVQAAVSRAIRMRPALRDTAIGENLYRCGPAVGERNN
jgi:hypothetical protein